MADDRMAERGIRDSAFDDGGGFSATELRCRVPDRADLVNSRFEMIEEARMAARAVRTAALRD